MKAALLMLGLVLGGLFVNDKMTTPQVEENKTEIVYGTRVGPDGNLNLVVTR